MYAHLHRIHIFILVSFLIALVVTYFGPATGGPK